MRLSSLALLIAFLGTAAHAGTGVTGGGTSVVCRDPQTNEIVGAPVLYDLYEAEHDPARNFQLERSDALVETQLEKIVASWSGGGEDARPLELTTIRHALKIVEKAWLETDGKTQIVMPQPDFTPSLLPKDPHCRLEVTAFYQDENEMVKVDSEIYGKMSNTDKAALKFHEALYKINREFAQDKTSDRTREMVAKAFGGKVVWLYSGLETLRTAPQTITMSGPKVDFIFGGQRLACKDKYERVVLTMDSKGNPYGEFTLPWKNEYFDPSISLRKLEPGEKERVFQEYKRATLSFRAGGDEYGASLDLSVEDLVNALDEANQGQAIRALYRLDEDSKDLLQSPIQPLHCNFK